MLEFTLLQKIVMWLIPTLFAITIHEVAHGFVANKLGDPTARMLGRLTLNPIKHIDLIGTIIVPALLYFTSGVIFGWAKPVPVDWRNLRNPRRDSALVAFAGPLANLLMALFWLLIIKLGLILLQQNIVSGAVLKQMGLIGIAINTILLVLNLIPIPPLDGSRIVSSLLSPRASLKYNKVEAYGFYILLFLLATGILNQFMNPIVYGLQALLLNIVS